MDTFNVVSRIRDVYRVKAGVHSLRLVELPKRIAAYPDQVIFGSTAIGEDSSQSTGQNKVVVAKKPYVLAERLLKALQEVGIGTHILSITNITGAKSTSQEILHHG